jgi:hypothetical protein
VVFARPKVALSTMVDFIRRTGLVWMAVLGVVTATATLVSSGALDLEEEGQFGLPKATWGPYVELGYTKSEFIHLSTIYTPGYPPTNNKGTIFLWPGLWDRKDQNRADLVQTVVEYYGSPIQNTLVCDAKPGEWVIS